MDKKRLEEKIIKHRRHLHTLAEVGFELEKTYSYVFSVLEELGYTPRKCGRCGITCEIGKDGGKCLILRADMDALPIKEETSLPFKSTNGKMHACGHDLHVAMLLGCAELLKENEEQIKGKIKLAFQPAEEILEGAYDMIKNGILEDPVADFAIMLHVLLIPKIDTDVAIIAPDGVAAPGCDMFRINVEGNGGHSGESNDKESPILLASKCIEQISSLDVVKEENAKISFGKINGGEAPNVSPTRVTVEGTIRTYSINDREKTIDELNTVISRLNTQKSRLSVDFLGSAPPLLNDASLRKTVISILTSRFGDKRVLVLERNKKRTFSGSEDFAYFSQKIPSLMIGINAPPIKKGAISSLHTSTTLFDEKVLSFGTDILFELALKIFG